MGGFAERTTNDGAFATLAALSLLSLYLFVPLILFYLVLVVQNRLIKKYDRK